MIFIKCCILLLTNLIRYIAFFVTWLKTIFPFYFLFFLSFYKYHHTENSDISNQLAAFASQYKEENFTLNRNTLFCKYCMFVFDFKILKKFSIEHHLSKAKHMRNCALKESYSNNCRQPSSVTLIHDAWLQFLHIYGNKNGSWKSLCHVYYFHFSTFRFWILL